MALLIGSLIEALNDCKWFYFCYWKWGRASGIYHLVYPLLLHTTSCCKHLHCFFLQIWHLASRHVDLFRILRTALIFLKRFFEERVLFGLARQFSWTSVSFVNSACNSGFKSLLSNSFTSNGWTENFLPHKSPPFSILYSNKSKVSFLTMFFAHFVLFLLLTLQKTERFSEHKSDIFRYALGHQGKS